MSNDETFEGKTFSKRMGEDSEGENSEEDFDEMVMDINYFRKQNNSCKPSLVCDPLMLDPTNMNENTIMLIRRIEENLSKKKVGEKLETKSDTYSLQQSTWSSNNESVPTLITNSSTNSNKCIKEQGEGKRDNSQQISVEKSFKNLWSPGNAHTSLSSKGTKSNPEIPSENPRENIDNNLQDPFVIEMNTNKLLRDMAKDIEKYKEMELTKPPSTTSTITTNVKFAQEINEEQDKTKENSGLETAKPEIPIPNSSGIKSYCNSTFKPIQIVVNHSRNVHHKINELSNQQKNRGKAKTKTPKSKKNPNNIIKCNCNLIFRSKSLLGQHLKTANCRFDKFKCEICQKKCWYEYSLVDHKRGKHGIETPS